MSKFIKIGEQIFNLAHVRRIYKTNYFGQPQYGIHLESRTSNYCDYATDMIFEYEEKDNGFSDAKRIYNNFVVNASSQTLEKN